MKLLDWIVALYPPHFRGQFGDSMRAALASDYERARARGWLAALLFVATTIPHALWFGLVERLPPPAAFHTFLTTDVRDAVRALTATPIVTIVSIASLALGIGANTALFSILNGLVIKSLPAQDPERLVVLDRTSWPNPVWEQIRARQYELFDGAGGWYPTQFNLAQAGRLDPVSGAYVSGGLFQVLGVEAFAGRAITPGDDVKGGGSDGLVAVISARFWKARFGGTRDVVGRQIALDRVRFTIVGVMPPGFLGPQVGRAMDVFLPLASEATVRGRESWLEGRSSWWLQLIARLKPDQTIDQAAAAFNAARPAIRDAALPANEPAGSRARYLSETIQFFPAATGVSPPDQFSDRGLRGRFARPLTIIMVVVIGVLVVACANIANLMLARATARQREMSLRLALGASRLRLAGQLLVESLMIAALGGLAGLAVAQFGGPFLIHQLGSDLDGVTLDLSIDWRVLGVTAAAALGATLLFGLAPALGIGQVEPNGVLKEHSRGAGERRTGFRSALIVAQVALSLALVAGGGLFIRTFAKLTMTPLGFDPENLLIVRADAMPTSIAPEERMAYAERVAAAVAGASGVLRASASRITPMSDGNTTAGIHLAGTDPRPGRGENITWVNYVQPGWFTTYGLRFSSGRDFAPVDRATAIVNQAFVRKFGNGQNVVGQRVQSVTPGGLDAEIVGVVSDSVYRTVRIGVVPTMYRPFGQGPTHRSEFSVTAKIAGPRAVVERDIADAIARVAPDLAFRFRDYSDQLRATVLQERLVALLSGFFGGLGMLLAALGVYGVTAYAVGQRRGEIAIRVALGASPRGVVRLVLSRVAALMIGGAVMGLALSLWAASYLESLLFGIDARDPLTFAGAVALLISVGLLAGWLPARRVSRLDPSAALRR